MALWQQLVDDIKLNFFEYISEGHAFLINHILQSFFFMMAIIQIISWILNKLNLFFAKDFARSNTIIKIFIFLLFLYIKVWDTYSAYLQILGYFCSVTVCIHLYEGCIRLGNYSCQRFSKNSFGNISSAISILLIFLSYKVFKLSHLQQKETKYPYVALYFLIFGLILIISLFRKKQFIYVLIITVMMGSIIMLRYWSLQLLKDTFLYKVSLPLECIIYLPLALQQSYSSRLQQNKIKRLQGQLEDIKQKVRPSQLLWAQIYYFVFFLINKRMYNIQIVFASICVFSYLGTRKFQ